MKILVNRRKAITAIGGCAALAIGPISGIAGNRNSSNTSLKEKTVSEHKNKVLIIVTSIGVFPQSAGEHAGRETGFYMDEMAIPYYAMQDAGYDVEIVSISGGKPPIDANSLGEELNRKPLVQRFLDDASSMSKLQDTKAVTDIVPEDYAAVFLPGGHGTMWDFRQSTHLASVIGKAWDAGAVIGAVCHGPAGLIEALDASGRPIVEGRKVNSFTDDEERAVELADTVPYLVETELRNKGALFEGGENFQAYAVRDGNLVTGQNPASATRVGELMIQALQDLPLKKAS